MIVYVAEFMPHSPGKLPSIVGIAATPECAEQLCAKDAQVNNEHLSPLVLHDWQQLGVGLWYVTAHETEPGRPGARITSYATYLVTEYPLEGEETP